MINDRPSAIHRQHIEGAELDFFIVLAGMKRVPVGIAINTQDDSLAIDDELLLSVFQSRFSNPGEAFCPIIAAPRDQPHTIAAALDAKPVPVIFYLVVPLRAGGNLGASNG